MEHGFSIFVYVLSLLLMIKRVKTICSGQIDLSEVFSARMVILQYMFCFVL